MNKELFLEIGTEEIPAAFLQDDGRLGKHHHKGVDKRASHLRWRSGLSRLPAACPCSEDVSLSSPMRKLPMWDPQLTWLSVPMPC
jgi:hypothetical protein